MALKPELAELCGRRLLARTQVVKQIWAYIKKNELQDPSDKRYIVCDEAMRQVFNVKRLHMMKMNKLLSDLLDDPTEEDLLEYEQQMDLDDE